MSSRSAIAAAGVFIVDALPPLPAAGTEPGDLYVLRTASPLAAGNLYGVVTNAAGNQSYALLSPGADFVAATLTAVYTPQGAGSFQVNVAGVVQTANGTALPITPAVQLVVRSVANALVSVTATTGTVVGVQQLSADSALVVFRPDVAGAYALEVVATGAAAATWQMACAPYLADFQSAAFP